MRFADSIVLAILAGAFAVAGARASETSQPGVAHSTCTNVMRIPEGFVPFDDCVASLTRSATVRNARAAAQPARMHTVFPGSDKSYTTSTSAERRAKEEQSCASVGQAPGTSGFTSCVTDLELAVQSAVRTD